MVRRQSIRLFARAAIAAALALPAPAQDPHGAEAMVLDSVVAVVNRHAILASDIDEEIRLSVLDPGQTSQEQLTRQHALEQLISRALIQQQIRREDFESVEPSPAEVKARISEIRRELPACVHENCVSEEKWKGFLASHDLTSERVDAYFRYRMEILRFIEQRFRPGIHIAPQEIEAYYRGTLLPQYTPGEIVPPLDTVSPRIEEILLQQKVNVLFDDWLTNLRKQGDVEVLDPALETPAEKTAEQENPDSDEKGYQ